MKRIKKSKFDFNPTPEMIEKAWDNVAKSYEGKSTKSENPTTGSLRFNSNKPQSNEICPEFLLGIGRVMEKSRAKYPRGNWAKGNDWSVPYDSMMRHLLAFQSGEETDSESNVEHLLHAATNLMFLYYYSKNFPELDDRLFKKVKK